MMKILHHNTILLSSIIFIGFLLRIMWLADNPPGLTWDEAAIGYNAKSILETGKDEYGTSFPLSFRSFDDYKPPAYIYFTVPFIALFGMNEFSVRIVSVIAGTLVIFGVYKLVQHALKSAQYESSFVQYVSLASALFIAVSPWSIQHSRGAFEGNLGICLLVYGLYFLLRGLKSFRYVLLSVVFFALALYAYHSFRLVIPLLLCMFALVYWRELLQQKARFAGAIILGSLLVFPIVVSLFAGSETAARLGMVSKYADPDLLELPIQRLARAQESGNILGQIINNRRIWYVLITIDGYFDHFDPAYLFLFGDPGKHHHASNMGVLYLFELPLILIGAVRLLKKRSRETFLLFSLLMIAPIPSAITTGTPHAIRSIAMMPVLHILSATGLVALIKYIRNQKQGIRIVSYTVIGCVVLINMTYYLHQYFVETPVEYADFWQSENETLYDYLASIDGQYDHIIVTYWYGEPYIYYLFYNDIDPAWYQDYWRTEGASYAGHLTRKIENYEFRKLDTGHDNQFSNTLLVGAPDEFPDDMSVLRDIILPDGTIMYRIAETDSL